MDVPTKTGLDALILLLKKAGHETAETVEFIGNKSVDRIVKLKPVPDVTVRNVEVLFPSVQREEILNELQQVL